MVETDRHEEEAIRGFDPHLSRRLFGYLRPYARTAALSVFLVILASALEVAAPIIIAVAIDLWVVPTQAAKVGFSAEIGSWLAAQGWHFDAISGINAATVGYMVLMAGGFVTMYSQMVMMNMMGQYVMYDLRKQIFGHLQRLDVSFFDRNPVGRLITRVTTDVEALNDMFTAGFVAIFGDIFVLLGIVGVLFWMNWKMALVLFSILPAIVIVSLWFRRGARRTYRMVRSRIAAINAFLQEHLGGMSVVQLFTREEEEAKRFAALNARHRDANIESIFYYAIFYPTIDLVQSIGIALIVWYGGGEVLRGTLSLGALVVFFQYAQRFYEPISDLSEKYNILQAAMAASERIFRLIDTRWEIESPPTPLGSGDPTVDEIEFEDVWFAYEGEDWVLRDVSFRVRRGERVAIVGHTGAGKTTVTNLLLRFYDVQRGAIRINGVDIREMELAELRRLFAIVQQDVFLFSGNVSRNISLGDPEIAEDQVRFAGERVHADPFIRRLPQGYASVVRERGAGFSSGEKQLLSFARALAFDPPVLILDEATSSIDTDTERLIQEGTEVLMEGRTSIVIAHRLSTIRSADEILVFHHGEIRERGTHDALMDGSGIYRRLYELQYREQQEELAS